MDRENFDSIIIRYLEKFDYTNGQGPEEYFKWQAIDCFQKNWDIDAVDLYDSFSKAIRKTSVLLDGSFSAPSSGIKALLKEKDEVEFVRDAFRHLLSTDTTLNQRDVVVERFVQEINSRIKQHWPNDKYKPQSTRSALCYLALAHPDQNFFYMWNKAENWANYTEFGFDIGSGSSFSLPVYYRMCEELVTEIKDDTELLECNAARMRKANVDIDDSYHTLAYDIIYCATTYHLYRDLPTYELKGVKNRISRANEREELDKLQQRVIEAEQELNHINTTYFFPIELCGQAVHHPYFGDGIITNQQDYKLTVKFGVKETSFIYPDAIMNKLLTLISPEIMERFRFAEELRADRFKREKALMTARTNYERKKVAFDAKWIKKIDNEAILEDDT